MFRVRRLAVVCMTTASLLNATSRLGIFRALLLESSTIIGDGTSQTPEPAFVALTARFSHARHIYIGDVHQLEPHEVLAGFVGRHLRSEGSYGAVAQEPDTFSAVHDDLPGLSCAKRPPEQNFYEGSLVNDTSAAQRRLLLESCLKSNRDVQFVSVDTLGTSHRSTSGSHSNEGEA
ncbi:hypothetical protein ANCDUO_15343 [Ancylostoma duodenale]|uniref:DNA2/NAM7 helicase helicase domain-containing protein n=1 Tax=Ancylostoma duodenale TaxID=51022 RepID=A0A0C2CXD0_9BILA|nr:hypothetical protein ANCDUO_15343 [Ancylostoma duodenale]